MTNETNSFTDLVFRNALFRMHGIRCCTVKLHRLASESIVVLSKPAKKKLLSTPKAKSIRFQVLWLPTIAIMTSSAKTKETPLSSYTERSGHAIGWNDAINSAYPSKPQESKYILAQMSVQYNMM